MTHFVPLFPSSDPTLQETERLATDPAPGISASPHEDNLRYFAGKIEGPEGSPFAGMKFYTLNLFFFYLRV